MAKLSDIRKAIEADVARSQTLLEALEILDKISVVDGSLATKQTLLADLSEKVDAARAALTAQEEILATRRQAVNDEVAAERARVQQDLAKLKASLDEVRLERYKEQGAREKEAKDFREQQAKWSKDNEVLIKNLMADTQEVKAVLEADLVSLRRQTDAERSKLAELKVEIKAVADWAVAQAQS